MADWEQLEKETDSAYVRFLIYRNLGAGRSLDVAYQEFLKNAPKRPKASNVSGQWKEDSVKYEWARRANAWDIETLSQVGQSVVAKYITAIDKFAERILQSLENEKLRPKSWSRAVDDLVTLGNFIPTETVEAVQAIAASNRMPAIGASGNGERRPESEATNRA